MSIQALRERRGAKAKELRQYMDKQAESGQQWSAADQGVYDAALAEIDDLDAQIGRYEAMLERQGDEVLRNAVREGIARQGVDNGGDREIFNRFMRGGFEAMTTDEIRSIRNTMSTTTGSQGGYTVPTEVATQVIEAMKAFGGMRNVADVFSTASGAAIQYPTSDGTAEIGEIIAQNTTATAQDPTFGLVTLNAYKFSSKTVAVPFELIQDSTVDIEGFVVARLATRLARIQNNKFTVGSGTNEPQGIFTGASVGVTAATGGATTVTYNNLVDTQHSVDPAYRGAASCKWMFNDSTLKVIRKIVDSNGRPIFVPGYQLQVPGGAPDSLLGNDIQINQDAPNLGANNTPIAFGDFSYYKIRDVMDVTMFRFTDSAYVKLGQVGFLAWQRSGGVYTGTGSNGPVTTFQNSAS